MFRVYDKSINRWAFGEFCISYRGDLFLIERTRFGKDRPKIVSDDRYIVQKCTNTYDSNGNMIYEGDIIQHTTDTDVLGVVAYYEPHACYYVFDEKHHSYFGLIDENREEMQIIGNVFDNQDLLNDNTEQDDAEQEEDIDDSN